MSIFQGDECIQDYQSAIAHMDIRLGNLRTDTDELRMSILSLQKSLSELLDNDSRDRVWFPKGSIN